VQSAVLALHVVRPSVRPSVGPNVGGSGPHRLASLETNCTNNLPNHFALRSPKAIHLLPGEHGEIWGRVEVGWEKMAFWSTKAAISLKHEKIERQLLWGPIGTHLHSFERYRQRPPSASPSPRLGVCTPPTQNSNRYYLRNGWSSQEREMLLISNLASTFWGSIRTKAH